ncbi:hypothetical protein [uncultured Ralstonia sp.]|jgi:hypothetical protein|uniref:hypothetical protein n=1 Tax=Ralstonia sp. TaxID=54061 RepID=UPI001EA8E709|nr:hypothetical protein [uncultured Ralstonia sp.]UCF24987.1 MAG: hypothetical protein JSV72_06075 [Ralstonia sp.]
MALTGGALPMVTGMEYRVVPSDKTVWLIGTVARCGPPSGFKPPPEPPPPPSSPPQAASTQETAAQAISVRGLNVVVLMVYSENVFLLVGLESL